MATKHTDGCFQKAEDTEELFTLLARDPISPFLVRFWAAIREVMGDDRVQEARTDAYEMDDWRHAERPHKPDLDPEVIYRALDRLRARGELPDRSSLALPSTPLTPEHATDCTCHQCGQAWCEANYAK